MFEFFDSTYGLTLIQISILNIAAVISPGPDFAIVMHNSLAHNRRAGIVTAIGISLGESIHALYTILGVGIIVAQTLWLLTVIKILGCSYLIYLGIKMISAKKSSPNSYKEEHSMEAISDSKALQNGLLTNLLNPKAIIFFVSIFSIVVDVNTPVDILFLYALTLVGTTLIWFVMVSILFSNKKIRNGFLRLRHWVERFIGGFLIIMSIKLLFTKENIS